jgi:hypothetical protein
LRKIRKSLFFLLADRWEYIGFLCVTFKGEKARLQECVLQKKNVAVDEVSLFPPWLLEFILVLNE